MKLTEVEKRELKRLTLNLQSLGVNKDNIEETLHKIGQAIRRDIYSQ